jgi:hypothetical protein
MKKVEIAVLTLLAALGISALASAATIKTIALQNEESPETGFFYKKFETPAVSDAAGERVADTVRLGGGKCIFAFNPDSDPDSTIVCRKDVTPDAHTFGSIGLPVGGESINLSSDVAWAARLSSGRSGVFRRGPAYVASIGDPVPGGTGVLKLLTYARIDDTGGVAFLSTISGGAVVLGVEVNEGIFRCPAGNCSVAQGGTPTLTTLALVNDPVPDRPGREFCDFLTLDGSTYGTVFRAATKLDCADTGEAPAVGVFRRTAAGTIATVALEGEPSNPTPAPGGTTYLRVAGTPAIANSGMVTFLATTGGLVTNNILFVCDPASCPGTPATDAVQQGETDDTTNPLGTYRIFTGGPGVDDAGDIAYSAQVRTATRVRHGIYIRRFNGTKERVVLGGMLTPVPGSNPPAVFDQVSAPAMSSAGKVAFPGRIERAARPRKLRALFIYE